MATLPKKVKERFSKNVSKFQRILSTAKDRDINESDTVNIITDMLNEVYGYDKYTEVTSEFAIRGTYCDLAIKLDNKVQFLIEVKAVGLDLKNNHLRQSIDYAANQGITWVILTNGMHWQIHKVRFEKPINHDLVADIDFSQVNPRIEKDQECLFLIAKEGVQKDVREEFYEKIQNINKYVIGNFLLSEPLISTLKRELRKFADGLKIESGELQEIIKNEVIKREIIDSEEGKKAESKVNRYLRKTTRMQGKQKESPTTGQVDMIDEIPEPLKTPTE
jgi:predicted type IV restriction endonuclease